MDAPLLARRALARPSAARLLVDGEDPDGPVCHGVELVDRHGVPVLLCRPGSALQRAAADHRSALLTVVGTSTGSSGPGPGATVLLRGELTPDGTEHDEGGEVAVIRLELAGVVVDLSADTEPVGIEVTAYLAAPSPGLAEHADLVRAHLNADHASELVACVAGLSGVDTGDVLVAELVELDATGLRLRWVDVDGSTEVRILFGRRATCPGHLADLLGQALGVEC